jgi:hypothetical protein
LSSDKRLKSDIKPLTDKLDKIYQLNGKSYIKHNNTEEVVLSDITDEKGNVLKKYEPSKKLTVDEKVEFGFLGQELKEIYPELVSQDTLGYFYVNYIGIIPILVEALKEQKQQIAELSAKINGNNSSGQKKVSSPGTTENLSEIFTSPILEQNSPNPFNIETTIGFYLPTDILNAQIYVYDLNGTQLKGYSIAQRGSGNIGIHAAELNAGIYLYSLIADGIVIDTKRMVLTN